MFLIFLTFFLFVNFVSLELPLPMNRETPMPSETHPPRFYTSLARDHLVIGD